MDRKEIVAAAEAYWDDHRDAIVADIAKLVEIPSTEDLAAAAPGAPYGPGRAAALDAALDKAYEAVGEIRFENAHYRKDIGRTR